MVPPSLDAFGVSISAHTECGCDRARGNGFPGPAVALDGSVSRGRLASGGWWRGGKDWSVEPKREGMEKK